jgi:DNA invertase Pin-like site-specific DNA recombinase
MIKTETAASDARAARGLGAGAIPQPQSMSSAGILIGYARCSTEKQDLTAQREILHGLGVAGERVYLDHGLTGTNRSPPGLNSALAALRDGDTLVVPKLDRLARSVPDARAIGDSLAARGVRLSLGGSV